MVLWDKIIVQMLISISISKCDQTDSPIDLVDSTNLISTQKTGGTTKWTPLELPIDEELTDEENSPESSKLGKTFKGAMSASEAFYTPVKFSNWKTWKKLFPRCGEEALMSPVNIITKSTQRDKKTQTLFVYSGEPVKRSYELSLDYKDDAHNLKMNLLHLKTKGRKFHEVTYITGLGDSSYRFFEYALFLFAKDKKTNGGVSTHQIDGKDFPMEILMLFTRHKVNLTQTTQVHVLVEVSLVENPLFVPIINAVKKIEDRISNTTNFEEMIEDTNEKCTQFKNYYNALRDKLKAEKAKETLENLKVIKVLLEQQQNQTLWGDHVIEATTNKIKSFTIKVEKLRNEFEHQIQKFNDEIAALVAQLSSFSDIAPTTTTTTTIEDEASSVAETETTIARRRKRDDDYDRNDADSSDPTTMEPESTPDAPGTPKSTIKDTSQDDAAKALILAQIDEKTRQKNETVDKITNNIKKYTNLIAEGRMNLTKLTTDKNEQEAILAHTFEEYQMARKTLNETNDAIKNLTSLMKIAEERLNHTQCLGELHQQQDLLKLNMDLDPAFQASWLFPPIGGHYMYSGSLPIPPCTARGYTIVLETPVVISREQFAILSSISQPKWGEPMDNCLPPLANLQSRSVSYNKKNLQFLLDDHVHMKSKKRKKLKTKNKENFAIHFTINLFLLSLSVFCH